MRNLSLTDTTPIHPQFIPFAENIEAELADKGPRAAIGLYVEAIECISKLIELWIADDPGTVLMFDGTDVGLSDLIEAAEYFGDKAEALATSYLH